ncbi:MAG: 50S ribosomal protein L9 [Malacoplasma sp.]|nr:50S ribosomal protein L9 [Mycoplasmataceae bacterium]MDY2887745.1 50S ribosomal protein L9 [Malacoplasma sp.]
MKVILLQDVKNLGKKNTIVNVNDGYFKNYLLPRKLAVIVSAASQKHLENDLDKLAEIEKQKIDNAKDLKQKLEKLSLEFSLKSQKGNAFGSISLKQIIDEIKKHGLEVTKFMFINYEPLKIGSFIIKATLYKDIVADVKVLVKEQ